MSEADETGVEPAEPAEAGKLQRRTIAAGVGIGFVAAIITTGAVLTFTGGGTGGGVERIADSDSTLTTVVETTSTTTVATAAPVAVDAAPSEDPAPAGGGQPGGSPSAASGGATLGADEPATLEDQVADHEQRITDLETEPPAPAPSEPVAELPPPPDPPNYQQARPDHCDAVWTDDRGWICP